jgi:flagellar hook-basal body complex protein FliE
MPIDPAFSVTGPEWQIGGIGAATPAAPATGGGFGELLSSSLQSLSATQAEAGQAAASFASGQDVDPASVVMAVERAQLSMQLASQIRTKAVDAAQDIFHTQV